jgi:hypothetical protein
VALERDSYTRIFLAMVMRGDWVSMAALHTNLEARIMID